jgi:hypothetical protein
VPKPVYWKPKYPTRVMRERAFAKRQVAREEKLRAEPRTSLLARLRAWLGSSG